MIEKFIFIFIIIFIIIILFIGSENFTNEPSHIPIQTPETININAGINYYKYAQKHETNPDEILRENNNIDLVNNCIMAYKMAYKYGVNNALFDIGRVYHYGIRNQGQSLKKAFKYYAIAYNNPRIYQDIKDKIINNIIIMSHENGVKYANKMLDYVITNNNIYRDQHILLLTECQDQLNPNNRHRNRNNEGRDNQIQRINNNILEEFMNNLGTVIAAIVPQHVDTRQYVHQAGDSQNVHDNVLGQIMNNNIINLEKFESNTSLNINEIYDLIQYSNEDLSIRSRAKKVLDDIITYNARLSRYDKTELEILELVWNRINQLDPTQVDNAKVMLVRQLADGYENGAVVCSTGRAMRVLSVLDGIDESFESGITKDIATNVIHNEIMNKAALLRNSTTLEGEELKNYIKTGLYNEYVGNNIMTETAFNNSINSWIDYIE